MIFLFVLLKLTFGFYGCKDSIKNWEKNPLSEKWQTEIKAPLVHYTSHGVGCGGVFRLLGKQ